VVSRPPLCRVGEVVLVRNATLHRITEVMDSPLQLSVRSATDVLPVFRSRGVLNCTWLFQDTRTTYLAERSGLASADVSDLLRLCTSVVGIEPLSFDSITLRRHRSCERTLVHFNEASQEHRCDWCRHSIDPVLHSELVFNLAFQLDNGQVRFRAEALPSVQEDMVECTANEFASLDHTAQHRKLAALLLRTFRLCLLPIPFSRPETGPAHVAGGWLIVSCERQK